MDYIGNGIYTYKEAAEITGINPNTIRRWIEGYQRTDSNSPISPIFQSDYAKIESKKALSFMDVIEILFIKSFQKYGLSIQLIRKAVEKASLILSSQHPFAMKKFYTDGKTILARIARESEIPELVDLIRRQYQFDTIVLPGLYECIDFNRYEIAERYWPQGKKSNIFIDPNINFGKPSLLGSDVPVNTILDFFTQGQSKIEIANWYDISIRDVELAISFGKRNAA
jgi:uncharacterized protein (DUF433 family)/DNA-binding transcriptional MerR regulator